MSPPSRPANEPQPVATGGAGQRNYIPTGQGQADQEYLALLQALGTGATKLPGFVDPSAYKYLQNIENNPYAGLVQQGAGQAQQYGMGTLVPGLEQAGGALYGAGNNILTQALDPQNALYNRTLQQVQDQSVATNNLYGLGSSPYGAGVTGQTLSNFNIDWQNNQLSRMLSGAQGAGQAFGQGAQLEGAVPGAIQAAQGAPYAAYYSLQQDPLNALSGLNQIISGSYGPAQTGLQGAGNYLGLGQSASQGYNAALDASYRQAVANYQAGLQGQNSLFSGLGSGLGGLFNLGSQPISGTSIFGNIGSGASNLFNDWVGASFAAEGA